ncbi:AAA family ATPase [Amycolatopsis sp. NPDC004169]|uniref:AAA family ATPase n=1 Tax=Amycolatopsis sp. NPDC004169 TaxID=3154453 RepID=UPI0033A45B32
MDITIRNIGPIKEASFSVDPLVVLVGPNNAGKSVAATVIYACLSTSNMPVANYRLDRRYSPGSSSGSSNTSDDDWGDLASFIVDTVGFRNNKEDIFEQIAEGDHVPPGLRETITQIVERLFDAYCLSIVDELERVFGTEILELRRVQQRATKAHITIRSTAPSWKIDIFIDSKGPNFVVEHPEWQPIWSLMAKHGFRRWGRFGPSRAMIAREIAIETRRACFYSLPNRTRYLPAARSGIMQSHKVIASTLIRQSSWAGLQDMRIPAMSGVVTDFLSEMIEIDVSYQGPFSKIASQLERGVLHGSVELRSSRGNSPELVFATKNGSYPLTRTSSMVSELAPVAVYLKNIIHAGELLIIEEPEAHLHPASQVAFAQILVRLVNAGLKVVMTTHSEFFLQQLNNSLAAGSLSQGEVAHLKFDRELQIRRDSVGAYTFVPGNRGTIARRLALDARYGIPDAGFDTVTEQLYNENVELDRQLETEN